MNRENSLLGNIYVAEHDNNLVRMVTPDGAVSSLFKYASYASAYDIDESVTTATANRAYNVGASKEGSNVFFTTFGPVNATQNNAALRVIRHGNDVSILIVQSLPFFRYCQVEPLH